MNKICRYLGPRPSRQLFCLLFTSVLLALCLIGSNAWANNAGGFVSTVTTSVTTGTETFGSQTNRFLDNGILHVSVGPTGSIYSIKYLKPGLSGTPKANGTEMISQVGFTGTTGGFGNHYNIYYYWYPDGNGSAAYLSTTGSSSTSMDLAYKSTYNPSVHQVPVDMEIHYVLGKGNTALYVYMVASHPSSYSSYGDMNISFMQMIWPVAHDSTKFTCENLYIDSVKTGLSLSGTQLMRQALEPNYQDSNLAVTVSGLPKEILQMTTGTFSGQLTGKYSYTTDYWKLGAWGRASDVNSLGQWVIQGSHEYLNNGPTVCEYADGWGLLYYEPCVAHYDNTGITVTGTSNWTKVYGPWMLYFNGLTTGTASWQDAKNQAVAEQAAWPYSWLTNSNYQPKSQRATVTGKLVINDSLRPGSNASGAWIGLAAPDSGVENASDNWQFQSDRHQYWTQAAADGTFTIPNVQTISPYGGSATYNLYAYSSGTSANTGSVGEFSLSTVPIASGSTTNLGTLTWNVPHQGSQLVWEIGIPDRTAAEFRHGDEYGKPALWWNFINEFTNPLEYNVSDNNWATALNYCHSVDNMATSPWQWHINFNLASVNQGTYYLNIAYAAPSSIQVIRVNDDASVFAAFTPDNANPGATTYWRQGIHSKYSVAHVAIPSSKLRAGANTITLDHEVHGDHVYACFMYDYINLEAPAPLVLPPGRDLVWKGGLSSNTWDNAVANWLVSGSSAPTVTYVDGDRPIFDDTGSNSPAIALSGTLMPGQVKVTANSKAYTLSGSGSMVGPMALIKSGSATLTVSGSNSYGGGTFITSGTLVSANDYALGTGPVSLDRSSLNFGVRALTQDLIVSGSCRFLSGDGGGKSALNGVAGSGILNVVIATGNVDLRGSMNLFNGTLLAGSGGNLRFFGSGGSANAAFDLGSNGSTSSRSNTTALALGSLTGGTGCTLGGASNYAVNLIYSIGGSGQSTTFQGKIVNGSFAGSTTGITKVGNGTLTLTGSHSYTGATTVVAGILRFTGTAAGSSGITVGASGTLEIAGGSLSISGAGINNGTLRLTGSGRLQTTGTFTNYGVVDIITGMPNLPANFVNHGLVVDSTAVVVQDIAISGSTPQLTIQSYIGHNYQLQRSSSLVSSPWSNVGAAQVGNDDVLQFTDPAPLPDKAFYKIMVSP